MKETVTFYVINVEMQVMLHPSFTKNTQWYKLSKCLYLFKEIFQIVRFYGRE